MTETPTTDQRIQTASLFILATVAVAFALYWLQAVMVPFVLSLFIARRVFRGPQLPPAGRWAGSDRDGLRRRHPFIVR